MGNLFAFRSTAPSQLLAVDDPVGPENDTWLKKLQDRCTLVVAAWGNHGIFLGRSRIVLGLLKTPMCFGVTGSGEPKHPLYLAASTKLVQLPSQ